MSRGFATDEEDSGKEYYCFTEMGKMLDKYALSLGDEEKYSYREMDAQLSEQKLSYTQMKQQEQMAEAKVRERTPAFTVIKQASVPNRHSSPRKVLILTGMLFLALSASIMHIYIRLLLSKKEEYV